MHGSVEIIPTWFSVVFLCLFSLSSSPATMAAAWKGGSSTSSSRGERRPRRRRDLPAEGSVAGSERRHLKQVVSPSRAAELPEQDRELPDEGRELPEEDRVAGSERRQL
jgi:hypothetical protein